MPLPFAQPLILKWPLSDDQLPKEVIQKIMDIGKEMLAHPIELLPHAVDALNTLASGHRLVLITKGDLFDQERKVAQSGIADLFDGVEIVADKSTDTYHRIFSQYGTNPASAVMVGNSLKSDVIPMLDAGGWGVYVPHELTWSIEHAEVPSDHQRFRQITSLSVLPALVDGLVDQATI